MGAIPGIRDLLNMNPNVLGARLYQNNPEFRALADSVSGMSPQEAFRQHGFDFDQVRQMIGR